MQTKPIILLIIILLFNVSLSSQPAKPKEPIDWDKAMYSEWVNAHIEKMSLNEMIGQLFWIGAPLNAGTSNLAYTESLIKAFKPGGVIFFKNTPQNIAEITNKLQEISDIPLLMSIDGEWGLGMRLQGAASFPFQMTLGAISHNQIIEDMGYEIGRQFSRLGLHANLAPVADINTNPENPIIGRRSFGESPSRVAQKTTYYMLGLQQAGVAAVAKHFPGHGDTAGDSHKLLPISNHSRARLDSVEFVPFRTLIKAGIMGVMTAHIEVPAIEPKQGLPATLSKNVNTVILKEEMGFKGFVITDGMNMHGVTASSKDGNVDMRALIAGNDIIELSVNMPKAFAEINSAIERGDITREEIELKCRKILALKEWCGLNSYTPANTSDIDKFINRPYVQWLNNKLYSRAVTAIKNNNIFPLQSGKYALIQLQGDNTIAGSLKKSDNMRTIFLPALNPQQIIKQTTPDDTLILIIDKPGSISNQALSEVIANRKTAVIYLGNPYQLNRFPVIEKAEAVIIQYENSDAAQKSIASFISGTSGASGRLPVSAGTFHCGEGTDIPAAESQTTIGVVF